MISNCLMWSSMIVIVMVLGSMSHVSARSMDGTSSIARIVAASSPLGDLSKSSAAALAGGAGEGGSHSLNKRAVFDQSCKGIYDQEIFRKLDRVCVDCYNLYRKPYVEIECRSNCYGNLVFRQCLDDLLLADVVDEYVTAVQLVGK